MPDPDLKLQLSRNIEDLKAVRVGADNKPLTEMTLAELIEMRPGGAGEAADSYSVNAFTDNVSVSTSSLLAEIGQITKERTMRTELEDRNLSVLRERLGRRVIDR